MPDTHILPPFDAYTGKDPYIFVSYSHADSDAVFPDLLRLHEDGYRIWYDEGIDPGNEWPDEIAKALSNASFFLVFISPRAVASRNVRNEINYALKYLKPLIAIHLAETQLGPGLELHLGAIQAIYGYRMKRNSYERKLYRALPSETKEPTSANAGKDSHHPAQALLARPRTQRVESLSRRTIPETASISTWEFSPSVSEIAMADDGGLIRLVSLIDSEEKVLNSRGRAISQIRFHPKAKIIATLESERSGTITQDPDTIRICGEEHSLELHDSNGCADLLFSPDGRWLVSGASVRADQKQITIIWQISEFAASGMFSVQPFQTLTNPNVESFTFDPPGDQLATGDSRGWIQIWNLRSRAERLRMYHEDEVLSVQFSRVG